jgi:hypothetical protein
LLNKIVIFWELFEELLEDVPLAVRQTTRLRSRALWGRCSVVVKSDISRKVDRTSRVIYMASKVAGSNSDGLFLVGQLKKHVYAVPPRNITDFETRFQTDMATVYAKHVKACSRESY